MADVDYTVPSEDRSFFALNEVDDVLEPKDYSGKARAVREPTNN